MVARLTNAISVNISLLLRAIWGDIGKHTVEKSRTNATNVIMHPIRQAIWGYIWKLTVEKSQTNATNVIMHPLRQVIWEDIWKHTVGQSKTNATIVDCGKWSLIMWINVDKSAWTNSAVLHASLMPFLYHINTNISFEFWMSKIFEHIKWNKESYEMEAQQQVIVTEGTFL